MNHLARICSNYCTEPVQSDYGGIFGLFNWILTGSSEPLSLIDCHLLLFYFFCDLTPIQYSARNLNVGLMNSGWIIGDPSPSGSNRKNCWYRHFCARCSSGPPGLTAVRSPFSGGSTKINFSGFRFFLLDIRGSWEFWNYSSLFPFLYRPVANNTPNLGIFSLQLSSYA